MDKKLKEIECVLTVLFTHSLAANPSVSADSKFADELVNRGQSLAQEIIKRYKEQLVEIEI